MLAKKKKDIQPWRLNILAHHNRKEQPRPKRSRNTDPEYMTKEKVRQAVIEREGGNWCVLSGKSGPGLHLHRIIYGSHGGKYEPDNCILLSLEMRQKVHSNKKKWMPELQEHIRCMKLGMPELSPIQRITHQ